VLGGGRSVVLLAQHMPLIERGRLTWRLQLGGGRGALCRLGLGCTTTACLAGLPSAGAGAGGAVRWLTSGSSSAAAAVAAELLPKSVDTIIISEGATAADAGCVGLACAHALVKEGHSDVLVLEASSQLAAAASGGGGTEATTTRDPAGSWMAGGGGGGLVGQVPSAAASGQGPGVPEEERARLACAMRSVAEYRALQEHPDESMPRPVRPARPEPEPEPEPVLPPRTCCRRPDVAW
jgi:hypothetical protein